MPGKPGLKESLQGQEEWLVRSSLGTLAEVGVALLVAATREQLARQHGYRSGLGVWPADRLLEGFDLQVARDGRACCTVHGLLPSICVVSRAVVSAPPASCLDRDRQGGAEQPEARGDSGVERGEPAA